jgi:3-hydroxyacyl-[acyl-carrier-protein] dehydratase|tara:strand:- start:895 stop:1392 length:498 start_codon:yes stop_codon:yes gene_type:complete
VSAKDLLIDPALLDFDQVVADVEEIRRYNPQRFEMEQLTAVIYEDLEEYACAGYKDIGRDEFWVRGHMPDMPLMPGVIVLEAAAQLCSFFSQKHDLLGAAMIGFGGLENVRFRAPIIPGDRLLLICKMTKVRPGRMIVCRFQAVVGETLVVDGMLKGIPIPVDAL